jgi:hypothetical protein
METLNERDFKLSGKIVNKKEKEFLKSIGCKYCAKCRSAKKELEFYKTQYTCKECSVKAKKEWLDKNPSFFSDYRATHKKQQKVAHRDWFVRNKEKKNAQNREWYYNNKEKKNAQNAEWKKEYSAKTHRLE